MLQHRHELVREIARGKFQTKAFTGEARVFLGEHLCGIPDLVVNSESVSYKEILSSTPTEPTWYQALHYALIKNGRWLAKLS